jgi:hypothetical protein
VFDQDVIGDFNARVPLSLWVDAAANPILPPYMQIRIAQAGWLRAVLLGRDEDARKLMRRVAELRPPASEVARGFLTAGDAEESRFAAVYLVLRTPSLSPSLPLPESRTLDFAETHYVDVGCRSCWTMEQRSQVPPATLDFLTPAQRAEGEAEWKRIRAAEPWQATYLTRETLDWARKHPDNPRVPEALHRAVMASRYRATDAETGKYSQQAFALLHQRYAKSEWAEKTKYWYK